MERRIEDQDTTHMYVFKNQSNFLISSSSNLISIFLSQLPLPKSLLAIRSGIHDADDDDDYIYFRESRMYTPQRYERTNRRLIIMLEPLERKRMN